MSLFNGKFIIIATRNLLKIVRSMLCNEVDNSVLNKCKPAEILNISATTKNKTEKKCALDLLHTLLFFFTTIKKGKCDQNKTNHIFRFNRTYYKLFLF